MNPNKFQVTNFTRSPMNPHRFLCKLACGCEQWVTRTRRPILGTTLLPCDQGHKSAADDPMPNGFQMLDVTENKP